jgi:hypothetical protein
MKRKSSNKKKPKVSVASLDRNEEIFDGCAVLAPKPNGHYARAEVLSVDRERHIAHVEFDSDDFLLADVAAPLYSLVPYPPLSSVQGTDNAHTCTLFQQIKRTREGKAVCWCCKNCPRGCASDSDESDSRDKSWTNDSGAAREACSRLCEGAPDRFPQARRSGQNLTFRMPLLASPPSSKSDNSPARHSAQLTRLVDAVSAAVATQNRLHPFEHSSSPDGNFLVVLALFEDWDQLYMLNRIVSLSSAIVSIADDSTGKRHCLTNRFVSVELTPCGIPKFLGCKKKRHEAAADMTSILWVAAMLDDWEEPQERKALAELLADRTRGLDQLRDCFGSDFAGSSTPLSSRLAAVLSVPLSPPKGNSRLAALSQVSADLALISGPPAPGQPGLLMIVVEWGDEATVVGGPAASAVIRVPLTLEQRALAKSVIAAAVAAPGLQTDAIVAALATSFFSPGPVLGLPVAVVLRWLLLEAEFLFPFDVSFSPRMLIIDECAERLQSDCRFFYASDVLCFNNAQFSVKSEDRSDSAQTPLAFESTTSVDQWMHRGGVLRVIPARGDWDVVLGACVARADFVAHILVRGLGGECPLSSEVIVDADHLHLPLLRRVVVCPDVSIGCSEVRGDVSVPNDLKQKQQSARRFKEEEPGSPAVSLRLSALSVFNEALLAPITRRGRGSSNGGGAVVAALLDAAAARQTSRVGRGAGSEPEMNDAGISPREFPRTHDLVRRLALMRSEPFPLQ